MSDWFGWLDLKDQLNNILFGLTVALMGLLWKFARKPASRMVEAWKGRRIQKRLAKDSAFVTTVVMAIRHPEIQTHLLDKASRSRFYAVIAALTFIWVTVRAEPLPPLALSTPEGVTVSIFLALPFGFAVLFAWSSGYYSSILRAAALGSISLDGTKFVIDDTEYLIPPKLSSQSSPSKEVVEHVEKGAN